MSKEAVMKHMGKAKEPKKGERKVHTHRMTIERADHGGHVLTHHMRDEDGNDAGQRTSVAMDNDDMGAQVQSAMGDQPAAGESAPPMTAPDPAEQAMPTQ